jgi:hypothetical protein
MTITIKKRYFIFIKKKVYLLKRGKNKMSYEPFNFSAIDYEFYRIPSVRLASIPIVVFKPKEYSYNIKLVLLIFVLFTHMEIAVI